MNPDRTVTLKRDEWLLLVGWLTSQLGDAQFEPAFMTHLLNAIKDAVEWKP